MRTFIIICLAILAVIYIFKSSEARSQKLMDIGECVNAQMDTDGYRGDYRLGWEMYAKQCE